MTSNGAGVDDRTVAALTEVMSVLDSVGRVRDAPGLYLVVSSSGSEYLVDMAEGRCECPDDSHRPSVTCKHRRRVAFVIGERPIPDWANQDTLDDQFGLHVEADPTRAVPDGGVAQATADSGSITQSGSGPLAIEPDDDPRTKRAKREAIDVAFLQKPGRYEVQSASDSVYEVDILEETCSCPDDASRCKHLRRVDIEIRAGLVPRPDGRLPEA
ncbi:SWIM zinc finger family protein [Haloarcula nitratireducens]|uniref:SWIM zinc finger family protein n=1 Tax=Haloarcula nitratireducens TaxID=2487749 RepID=A0AAW4PK00_9EURY|nr:SWIM zinc finger family protein [Halomicroarcula nitratireducens]MBX0298329.1 SWIM zinc finger family protein [Halomicroarcula nitratireducens]